MTPRIADIQIAVFEHFKMRRFADLFSHRRAREITRPRQVAMYLCCELTTECITTIGERFDRDHSTILHARRLVPELAERDPSIAKAIDDITRQLTDDPRQIKLPLVA